MAYTLREALPIDFARGVSNSDILFFNREMSRALISYMYSPSNDFFQDWEKIFGTQTSDAILSIRIYPFDISNISGVKINNVYSTATVAGHELDSILTGYQKPVYAIGGGVGTKVSRPKVSFGKFVVPYFQNVDSFLSYEPYSKIKLYLPFMEDLVELDCKRIRGKNLYVDGYIDFINGDMIYYLTYGANYDFLAEYKVHITLDSETFGTNLKDNFRKDFNNIAGFTKNLVSGEYVNAVGNVVDMATKDITRSRATIGNLDVLGNYNLPIAPTLLIYDPIVKYPLNDTGYAHITGIPCEKVDTLNNFSGFTIVSEVHSKSIAGATDKEIAEIEELLKKGVYL